MEIKKVLVPSSKYGIKCPNSMTPKGIVFHNTANDASAMAEISYMIGNNNYVSYHYAVDDYRVVQGIPDNRNAWHCGATYGNRNYIGVECCYSKSGGDRFVKAEKNSAKFIAMKLKEYGWGIDKLFTHQQMSGKYCPHRTLDLGWERFKNMVRAELGQTVTPPKPSQPQTSGYTGSSIVEYLKSINVDSSFANRSMLAKKYGIGKYSGTALQNNQLLNKMRGGSTPKPSGKPTASVSTMANEIIKGLHGNGHAQREASLKSKYSNVNYQAVKNEVNRRL